MKHLPGETSATIVKADPMAAPSLDAAQHETQPIDIMEVPILSIAQNEVPALTPAPTEKPRCEEAAADGAPSEAVAEEFTPSDDEAGVGCPQVVFFF